jgi:hypothetical protein
MASLQKLQKDLKIQEKGKSDDDKQIIRLKEYIANSKKPKILGPGMDPKNLSIYKLTPAVVSRTTQELKDVEARRTKREAVIEGLKKQIANEQKFIEEVAKQKQAKANANAAAKAETARLAATEQYALNADTAAKRASIARAAKENARLAAENTRLAAINAATPTPGLIDTLKSAVGFNPANANRAKLDGLVVEARQLAKNLTAAANRINTTMKGGKHRNRRTRRR